MAGPFVERLAEKLRTSVPEVNPFALAALLDDRRDATEGLQVIGCGIAFALRPEGGQEARRQGRTGARERIEDGKVRMCPVGLLDLLFQLRDASAQASDQFH